MCDSRPHTLWRAKKSRFAVHGKGWAYFAAKVGVSLTASSVLRRCADDPPHNATCGIPETKVFPKPKRVINLPAAITLPVVVERIFADGGCSCAFDLECAGLTALFCRTNSARTEKAPSSRSTPNEAVTTGDACPPHGKFRCLELHLQRRGTDQVTEFVSPARALRRSSRNSRR